MPGTPGSFKARVGTMEELLSWGVSHRPEIRKRSMDPEPHIAVLTQVLTAWKQANTMQEALKVQLKDQTKAFTALDRQAFELTTSTIDAFSGIFGKFSNESVQLRRIRQKVRKPAVPKA